MADSYKFGDFRLIPGQRRLLGPDGEPVILRGKVYDLLLYLVEHRGQVVEKNALMEALWPNVVVDENNLNQAMTSLRQALGEDAKSPKFITTVTGRGYQFIGEVRVVEEGAGPEVPTGSNRVVMFGAVAVIAAIVVVFFMSREEPPPLVTNAALDQFRELSPRLVTDFHGSHSEPTLSPDGSMMAWVSDIGGSSQLWVVNLQVGDPIQITHDEFAVKSPSWSPDNSQIIYERKGQRGAGIFSVDTLGTSPPRMLIEFGKEPSFSRQANQFVFTRGKQIWLASGDGSNERKIQNLPIEQGFADRMPALSPDGTQVAFVHAEAGPIGNLWIIGTEKGAEARPLTDYNLEEFRYVTAPAFSANGEEIVYSLNENNGTAGLWRVSVEGGEPQPLTSGTGTFSYAEMSATGDRIAYTDRRLAYRIIVIDPQTDERRTIFESRNAIALPLGSPSGEQIVFFSPLSNGMQVMTIDSDGRSLRQRTFNDAGANTLPFFGPDENSIYYYENRSLVRQFLDEGRTETVFEDFHWSTRNWAAVHGNRITYQEIDRTTMDRRSIIRNLGDDAIEELPVNLEGMTWSKDGSEILGFIRGSGDIMICDSETLECEAVTDMGEPIRAYLPRFSRDEQQIFFSRYSDSGDCCDLWVINRDGSDRRQLLHMDGFDTEGSFFGVTENDEVFYNYMDGGNDEIWLIVAE